MFKTTQRALILGIPALFKEHYVDACLLGKGDKQETLDKLLALDLETVEEETVNEIMGNNTWTRITCDNCNTPQTEAIILGSYGCIATVCKTCLTKALALL